MCDFFKRILIEFFTMARETFLFCCLNTWTTWAGRKGKRLEKSKHETTIKSYWWSIRVHLRRVECTLDQFHRACTIAASFLPQTPAQPTEHYKAPACRRRSSRCRLSEQKLDFRCARRSCWRFDSYWLEPYPIELQSSSASPLIRDRWLDILQNSF